MEMLKKLELKRASFEKKNLMIDSNFTWEQIRILRDEFKRMDVDGTAVITEEQLVAGLQTSVRKQSRETTERILDEVTKHSAEVIDFNRFLEIMMYSRKTDPELEVAQIFRMYDADNDGFISAQDLSGAMLYYGEPIDDEEAEAMVSAANEDEEDVGINFKDFQKLMRRKVRYFQGVVQLGESTK